MTPDYTLTIKANPELTTNEVLSEIIAEHPYAENFRYALTDIVSNKEDVRVELYSIPDMEGDYVSNVHGTKLLWMPDDGRAALDGFQAGGWFWTDASDPEDALRRWDEGDLEP